ncbi:hypothetical protein HK405_012141, partial [Cladochytrium tenue]
MSINGSGGSDNASLVESAVAAVSDESEPGYYHAVGITLALTSGLFIGASFIFKKKGLILTNALHGDVGAGHAYLRSPMWWTGMILMALGEIANFGAYAFTPAILVTPLGALSVVISAILSSIFLEEKLSFSGKVGCAQCLVGAVIIVLHAPTSNSTETIPEFFSYVLSAGFIVYSLLVAGILLYLIYGVVPKYGDRHPIVYITICSMGGFGSSIVYSARHWHDDNQFLQWPIYPLFAFVVFTICVQIHFLNKALNRFSTAVVTPVYYVCFTTATLISSAVLFKGFAVDSAVSGATLVMGFLVIVGGVALLFEFNLKDMAAAKAAADATAAAAATATSGGPVRQSARSSKEASAVNETATLPSVVRAAAVAAGEIDGSQRALEGACGSGDATDEGDAEGGDNNAEDDDDDGDAEEARSTSSATTTPAWTGSSGGTVGVAAGRRRGRRRRAEGASTNVRRGSKASAQSTQAAAPTDGGVVVSAGAAAGRAWAALAAGLGLAGSTANGSGGGGGGERGGGPLLPLHRGDGGDGAAGDDDGGFLAAHGSSSNAVEAGNGRPRRFLLGRRVPDAYNGANDGDNRGSRGDSGSSVGGGGGNEAEGIATSSTNLLEGADPGGAADG